MIQITHYQEAEKVVQTLSSMKSFLESTLDRRAPDKLGEWGKSWIDYREQGGTLQDIIPQLPKWVQIQYQQLATIHRFVTVSKEAIKRLDGEVQQSYHDGIKKGREASPDRTDHLWRSRWTLGEMLSRLPVFPEAMRHLKSKELKRTATIKMAQSTWKELF